MTSDNNGGRTGGMRGAGVGKEGANMGDRNATPQQKGSYYIHSSLRQI